MDLVDQDCFFAALLMQCKSGNHTFWKDLRKVRVNILSISENLLGLDQDDEMDEVQVDEESPLDEEKATTGNEEITE